MDMVTEGRVLNLNSLYQQLSGNVCRTAPVHVLVCENRLSDSKISKHTNQSVQAFLFANSSPPQKGEDLVGEGTLHLAALLPSKVA